MKKLFLLMLCLLMAVGVTLAAAEDTVHTSGAWQYRVLKDGTVEITAYTGSASTVSIPDKLGGRRVTAIGNDAFSQCDFLTDVTVPKGVTRIGSGAFTYCYGLESISLPDSVKSIGDGTFSDCMSLRSIAIPAGVTAIGDSTFYNCKSLATVTLPAGLKTIGAAAFYSCGALTVINVPDGVTAIGDTAFFFCESLTSVALPASVKSIGDRAFAFCSDELTVAAPEGSFAQGYCRENAVQVLCSFCLLLNPDGHTRIQAGQQGELPVFALEDMSPTENPVPVGSVTTYTVQGHNNPKSDNALARDTIPTSGSVMYFVAPTDGIVTVSGINGTYSDGTGRVFNQVRTNSAGDIIEITNTTAAGPITLSLEILAGETIYFFNEGAKFQFAVFCFEPY